MPNFLLRRVLQRSLDFQFLEATKNYQYPSSFNHWYRQFVLGKGNMYYPTHPGSRITRPEKICAGIDSYPGSMPGCYIQSREGIIVGDYSQFAPNIGLISSNHDLYDTRKHVKAKPIRIGSYCWVGFGAVILPGVELGDFTIVGANAVVTKSFPEGHCVIGGNPAKIIKRLDEKQCIRYDYQKKYIGFIPYDQFEAYRAQFLEI